MPCRVYRQLSADSSQTLYPCAAELRIPDTGAHKAGNPHPPLQAFMPEEAQTLPGRSWGQILSPRASFIFARLKDRIETHSVRSMKTYRTDSAVQRKWATSEREIKYRSLRPRRLITRRRQFRARSRFFLSTPYYFRYLRGAPITMRGPINPLSFTITALMLCFFGNAAPIWRHSHTCSMKLESTGLGIFVQGLRALQIVSRLANPAS